MVQEGVGVAEEVVEELEEEEQLEILAWQCLMVWVQFEVEILQRRFLAMPEEALGQMLGEVEEVVGEVEEVLDQEAAEGEEEGLEE